MEVLLGLTKDSTVLKNLDQGTYKISMFSELAFGKSKIEKDYAMYGLDLNENERNLKKMYSENYQKILNMGTETVFLTKDGTRRVFIRNKTVNNMLKTRDYTALICLSGTCLGLTGLFVLIGFFYILSLFNI